MRNITIITVRLLLIGLFTYTGISKILSHHSFNSFLQGFPWLTYIEPLIAWMLPVLELFIAMLLMVPVFQAKGLLLSLIMFLLFIIYVTAIAISGKNLPCLCGGLIETLSWKQHIWLNAFCLIISGVALYLVRYNKKVKK